MCFSVRRRVGTFGGKLTKVGRTGKVRATLFYFCGRSCIGGRATLQWDTSIGDRSRLVSFCIASLLQAEDTRRDLGYRVTSESFIMCKV